MKTTTATLTGFQNIPFPVLFLAMELSQKKWKLGFTIGLGQPLRHCTVSARDLPRLAREVDRARRRFGLAADTPVRSCYEAGREGYWLHRALETLGIENVIVDSSSIEVNRRARQAKSDRLDVRKLARLLMRYTAGEKKVWSVIEVATEQDEDDRHWHREVTTLQQERNRLINRIRALLFGQGVALPTGQGWTHQLEVDRLRDWRGAGLRPGLRDRLSRELERLRFIDQQLEELEQIRDRMLAEEPSPKIQAIRDLMRLRALGKQTAWSLVMEFGWRHFSNRRQIGSLGGLAPSPWQSGDMDHQQGISKAGNVWVRGKMVQIAWVWIRSQPHSPITEWFQRRFAQGSRRQRKIGIVAVARKLLIALVQFLQDGVLPEGAQLKPAV